MRGEIQNDDIRDGGALTVIGRSANSSGDIADIAAVAASAAAEMEVAEGSIILDIRFPLRQHPLCA